MQRAPLVFSICCLFFPATARPQVGRVDSLRMLGAAHAAQIRFERERRGLLPLGDDPGGDQCETVVGRMCYWPEDNSERPMPDSRSIINARLALLATLGRLNSASPGDNWIAGQRIRYMIESGEDSAAVSVARSCSPPRWYCKVLLGYALHASERYADAAAAFDSALAEMPAPERCRWNDISVLLDDGARDSYDQLPCGQRDSVEKRFWDLAQPSFAVGGNDRRTEHFSRVLLADLSEDAANAYGLVWGPDMRELLIRYGEPLWYSGTWPTGSGASRTPIGHNKVPSFHFAADMEGDSARWDAHAPMARERYAPPYMDTLTNLDAQFAMMKRGDSALVVAIYADPARDTTNTETLLGIGGGAISDTAPTTHRPGHVRRARTGWKGVMVAMEEFNPARRSDARRREWLEPPPHVRGAPDLSTLLLFSADTSAHVETLNDALAHALTANDLRGTRRLGLYWEVYGAVHDSSGRPAVPAVGADSQAVTPVDSSSLTTGDSSSVLVTVMRTDGGVLRWLGNALRITRRDSPLAVRWNDSHAGAGIAAHSVVLDLAQLPEGTYRVTVAVGADDAHRTDVSREIRLR